MTFRAAVLAVVLLLLPQGARAQAPAPPVAETVAIPLIEKRPLGARRELHLEGFLYRLPAPGRVPVLVFNHGSTGAGRVSPSSTAQYRYPEVARFFVERGWAVLIPMRRGRGASGGEYLERYDCDRAILAAGVERAIEDLDAALAFVSAQPWADPTRLLLGGMSRGGLLAVVYPSRRAVAARGVVTFAGGWTVERCDDRTHPRTTATTAPRPSAPTTKGSSGRAGRRRSRCSRPSATTGTSCCPARCAPGGPRWRVPGRARPRRAAGHTVRAQIV